jgi:hypothetical protein
MMVVGARDGARVPSLLSGERVGLLVGLRLSGLLVGLFVGFSVIGLGVGSPVGIGVAFGLGASVGSGLGASVGSGVGFRVGLSVKGAFVAGGKVDCGPNLALHPHDEAFTATEQRTDTFDAAQNATGSSPSTCVPKRVKVSRVSNRFPSSVGMVPSAKRRSRSEKSWLFSRDVSVETLPVKALKSNHRFLNPG